MGRLEEDIRSLGNRSATIVRKLRKAHVRGVIDQCFDDPVSMWLEGRGWHNCALGGDEWVAYRNDFVEYDECEPVPAAQEFLHRFDRGEYPDLVCAKRAR